MPELPDVENFRRYLNSTALHKTIEDVDIRQESLLGNIQDADLRGALLYRTLEETMRHGKYLFTRLDSGDWLGMHFGMTGFLDYYKTNGKEPAHSRVLLRLANGHILAYVSQRKLGSLYLIRDGVQAFIREKKLGPDALDLSREEFIRTLTSSGSMAKSALMRQENVAGIGNVYSDEILFQAGVHPRAAVKNLREKTLDKLYQSTGRVLKKAIDKDADPGKFPQDFIIPRRHDGGQCPVCSESLKKIKVSGRTGWYCPICQSR